MQSNSLNQSKTARIPHTHNLGTIHINLEINIFFQHSTVKRFTKPDMRTHRNLLIENDKDQGQSNLGTSSKLVK